MRDFKQAMITCELAPGNHECMVDDVPVYIVSYTTDALKTSKSNKAYHFPMARHKDVFRCPIGYYVAMVFLQSTERVGNSAPVGLPPVLEDERRHQDWLVSLQLSMLTCCNHAPYEDSFSHAISCMPHLMILFPMPNHPWLNHVVNVSLQ
jgi:hypothetical protein